MTFSTWYPRQPAKAPDPNLTARQFRWKRRVIVLVAPEKSSGEDMSRWAWGTRRLPPSRRASSGHCERERPGLVAWVPLQQLLTIPTLICFALGRSPFLCLLLGTDLKPLPSLMGNISSFFSVWGWVQHLDHKFFTASTDGKYQLSQYYVWFYCHLYFWVDLLDFLHLRNIGLVPSTVKIPNCPVVKGNVLLLVMEQSFTCACPRYVIQRLLPYARY